MASAEIPPAVVAAADRYVINVNDESKWETSEGQSEGQQGIAHPLAIDSSVPGSWKSNNGTNCWDQSIPPPTTTTPRNQGGVGPTKLSSIGTTTSSKQAGGFNSKQVECKPDPDPSSSSGIIVEVLPYDPTWPLKFEQESFKIKEALDSLLITIHHIGSTSIQGLPAKPIINIIPVVKNILDMDLPLARSKLESLGYIYKGENGIPFRRFYTKNSSCDDNNQNRRRTFHIHIFQDGHPEIEHHLEFRNYLRNYSSDNNVVKQYAKLKLDLASKYPHDMNKYCLGKSEFITNILKNRLNLQHNSVILRNCYTNEEWMTYKKLIINEPILEQQLNYYQFVLYFKFEIVGAVQIELIHEDDGRFNIINLAMDLKWNGRFDIEMKNILQLWCSHQHFITKLTQE